MHNDDYITFGKWARKGYCESAQVNRHSVVIKYFSAPGTSQVFAYQELNTNNTENTFSSKQLRAHY